MNSDDMTIEDRVKLWNKAMSGNSKALVLLSYLNGMITKDDFDEFERIEKFRKECES